MEEMRRIRNLKRQLEAEYNIENAYELAEALVNTGATEMTDDIREKIHYLQQICKDVAFNNYWFVTLLSNHSLEDIKEHYDLYVKYVGCDLCEVDCLAFSCEKEAAYISLLSEFGFSYEQIANTMRKIVENGSIAKSEEDARRIIEDMNVFGIADDVRNRFISDNADFLFNDYSREVYKVFEHLCQKYGKEDGFAYLQEHPEYIRFGIKTIMLSEGIK